ncbi:MAG: hypothetical protein MPJ22_06585 [Pirellulales bacterium]|nr:AbrB/MazE/SpoVT family DNA-binding domain-containing protein [Alphaproteobacteria bacterium]MDA8010412.1 AbrB/MazE/SpoVT family DNA-binding domain-containing protein [Alphaproteobacteria bacterium]MDA8042064.1 hypothetical protein [Pirellulales bacterium]
MSALKIVKNDGGQRVHIPEELAFDEAITRITAYRVGRKLILEPARKRESWLTLFENHEPADDNFMAERPDVFPDERPVKF